MLSHTHIYTERRRTTMTPFFDIVTRFHSVLKSTPRYVVLVGPVIRLRMWRVDVCRFAHMNACRWVRINARKVLRKRAHTAQRVKRSVKLVLIGNLVNLGLFICCLHPPVVCIFCAHVFVCMKSSHIEWPRLCRVTGGMFDCWNV